jgi:hypothetical protein
MRHTHEMHAHEVHAHEIHPREMHAHDLRVFLARRTRVARVPVSTPRMFLKLLIVGDSIVRLLITLGACSAW